MFLDPRSLFMLAVLVGVSGLVARTLMITWHRLSRGDKSAGANVTEMESRLQKVEAATSSLLVDVHGMREKDRFMARLQATAPQREASAKNETRKEGELSPMVTQSIPIIPKVGSPRY